MGGQFGGSGRRGSATTRTGLPAEYRGNLFFCDWGLQAVHRFVVRKNGGTFTIASRTPLVTKGEVGDFRPFSLAVAADGAGFWLVDWGYNGWLDGKVQTGRLYRLRYNGPDAPKPAPRPSGRDRLARLVGAGPSGALGPAGVAADPGDDGTGRGAGPRRAAEGRRTGGRPASCDLGARCDRRPGGAAGDRLGARPMPRRGSASRRRARPASAATGMRCRRSSAC